MMGQDLVLEIGTEEIPARFVPGALEALRRLAEERLTQARLPFREIKTVGTPRRLALLVFEMASVQSDQEEVLIGPPRSAAFGEDGAPTKVALGFARAKGVPVEDLSLLSTPKGVYLGLKKRIIGRTAPAVLGELLPRLILDLPFPKTMRWGASSLRFARPIHWIVALYGTEVIPFSLEGIASGRQSFGHRFMSPGPLPLARAADYLERLSAGKVVVDPEERRAILTRELESQARRAGGKVLIDPQLLEEVTNLVEFPVPVTGRFDEDFLNLPAEVLVTSMKEHQRYFPLVDEQSKLINRFIAVNNTQVTDEQRVIRGHEKVLRARLSDARFFFQEDSREPLEGKVERLRGVVFHSKLGTSYEKMERVTRAGGLSGPTPGPGKGAGGPTLRQAGQGRSHQSHGGGVSHPAGHYGPRVCPAFRGGARSRPGDSRALPPAVGAGPPPGLRYRGAGRSGRPARHPGRLFQSEPDPYRLGRSLCPAPSGPGGDPDYLGQGLRFFPGGGTGPGHRPLPGHFGG